MQLSMLPLLLHAVVETAAALSFLLSPQSQLPGASSETVLVLRSYGGLLLASAVLCGGFCMRAEGFDAAARLVAGSMAVYHVFPVGRAYVRLRRGRATTRGRVLGGPAVHLVVHMVALAGLALSAVYGGDGV